MAKSEVIQMKEEQVKPIILQDNETGEEYTLEFDRESVKFAESKGFVIEDVERFPMTKFPELFFYAFRKHHRNMARANTDKILFEQLGGLPDGFAERLGQLYSAPFEAFNNKDNGEGKNSRMTVVL